jgi:hypothetical protein
MWKTYNRMMIGIGMPTAHKIQPLPIIASFDCLSVSTADVGAGSNPQKASQVAAGSPVPAIVSPGSCAQPDAGAATEILLQITVAPAA